jgi:putative transposon-encoded protein
MRFSTRVGSVAEKQGKVFEKTVTVTRQIRTRGEKEYEYGMVWVLLPREYIGKKALVRVYLIEEGQKPPPISESAKPQEQPAKTQLTREDIKRLREKLGIKPVSRLW